MIKQYYKSIGVKKRKQDVITFVNTVITLPIKSPEKPIKITYNPDNTSFFYRV